MRTFGAGQWAELQTFIDQEFGQGFGNHDFVFRGEVRQFQPVWPKIDRLLPPASTGHNERLGLEWKAMLRFCQHAPMHLSDVERGLLGPGIQPQVVMRHYGAPTRLLDWTASPWVALFFACEDAGTPDAGNLTTGRVISFDRRAVEGAVAERFSAQSRSHAELDPSRGHLPRMLTPEFVQSAQDWVVCFHHHGVQFPRLVAQQGLFTIASKPWLDHWEQAKRLSPDRHHEILIAPGLKAEVLRRLARMGITAATLFPDIGGVAREVEANVRIFLD